MTVTEVKYAIEDILKKADPPIQANFDLKQISAFRDCTSKPGTRANWREVKSVFNRWKKVTKKGKLRGALVKFVNETKIGEDHGTYVGFEDDGNYSTGLLDDW